MSIAENQETRRLGPQLNGIAMTAEEFDAAGECDDLYQYELIHGVLIVNPIPSEQERDPNGELEYLLRTYRYDHPQGDCIDATLSEEYVHTPAGRRIADRVIWAGLGRVPDPRTDVPTIVVEFVSHGRRNWLRDYVEKRDEYFALGVGEYWIFDRFRRTLTVHQKTADGVTEQIVPDTETYCTEILPGFEVPVQRLFAAADRWDKK
jgi:Uma2 family endonuclease